MSEIEKQIRERIEEMKKENEAFFAEKKALPLREELQKQNTELQAQLSKANEQLAAYRVILKQFL